jgi:flagellar hook assembly protein FlgD
MENAAQRRPAGNPLDAVASSTTIRFQMPGSGGPSKIEVFDAAGRHVTTLVDGYLKGGMQSVRWAGTDESGRAMRSGVYLARVQAAAIAQTVRLVLLR